MKKGFLIIFTLFYFGLFIVLIDLVSRNFIGPLPGVLTLAALVAAFILSVGLAQFTANKVEVLASQKRKILLAIVSLLLILAVIVVFDKAKGKKPFQDLEVGYFWGFCRAGTAGDNGSDHRIGRACRISE